MGTAHHAPLLGALAFALALLGSGCAEDPLEGAPTQEWANKRYLSDRLSLVCEGRVYPQAAAYQPGAPAKRPTGLFTTFERSDSGDWYPGRQNPWEPSSIEETQLVGCTVFPASGSTQNTAKVRLIAAKTGQLVAQTEVEFRPYGGDSAKHAEVVKALRPIVEGAGAPAPAQPPATPGAPVPAQMPPATGAIAP